MSMLYFLQSSAQACYIGRLGYLNSNLSQSFEGWLPLGKGLLMMKKSPAPLDNRPSNSQQQIISRSGVQACAKHRSTCKHWLQGLDHMLKVLPTCRRLLKWRSSITAAGIDNVRLRHLFLEGRAVLHAMRTPLDTTVTVQAYGV